MKNEVGAPVIIAIIVVVLLIVGGIAFSMFGSKPKTGADPREEQYMKDHPDAAAKYKAGVSPTK